MKIILEPPFTVKDTGSKVQDLKANLRELVRIFERLIEQYPAEYLWTYKIWKYTTQKSILILSDGKAGHLRQSQAAAEIIRGSLQERGVAVSINIEEARFKNRFFQSALVVCGLLSGRYNCQGCVSCLRHSLTDDSYRSLISRKYDYIISAGSSVAALNILLARENQARSIAIMKPGLAGVKKFDLVIVPAHDRLKPRGNVAVTDGSLNLINGEYLENQSRLLLGSCDIRLRRLGPCIGLLIGGDTKDVRFSQELMRQVIGQVKSIAARLEADILVTTSRRTSPEIERLVKSEFEREPACRLLIIANEKNIAYAVGGILGLSSIVVVSGESVSMVSEAASSGRYCVVFNPPGLPEKHLRFLDHLQKKGYVYKTQAEELGDTVAQLWRTKPKAFTLQDASKIKEALLGIL